MTTFPIRLIPSVISNVKKDAPIVPAFTAIAPSPPSPEPQPLDINALTTYATIGLFVSVAFVLINPALGITSGLLSFAVIAYAAWTMNQSFPQRKREHDDYVRKYPSLEQQHQAAKNKHSAEVAVINRPENVARYQQEQLLLTLRQTEPHDGENSTAPKGFSEDKYCKIRVSSLFA